MTDTPKPTDLLLDVSSFFAILLPGTIVAMIAPLVLTGNGSVPRWILDPAANWPAFLVASYVAGQVVYALASWFLDPIGDITYRRWRVSHGTALIREVKKRLANVYGEHAEQTGLFPLARAYLLGSNPGAYLTIERIEADSKFFRSMTMAALLIAGTIIVSSLQWGSEIVFGASGLAAVAAALLAVVSSSKVKELMQKALLALALFLLLSAMGVIGVVSWFVAFGFGALTLVLFLRFAPQKWQRNETLNELVLLEMHAKTREQGVSEASRPEGPAP